VKFADLARQGADFEGEARRVFEDALSTVGAVAVSDIPGYDALRRRVLREAHRCIRASPEAVDQSFEDGTVRRSLAGVKDASGAQDILLGQGAEVEAECAAFRRSSDEFRNMVSLAADAFGSRLDDLLGMEESSPLMRAAEGGGAYETVSDVFHHGQHLEHFHSYHLPAPRAGADKTIDFHTDQGLCIAFTSALLVDESDAGVRGTDRPAGEFQIQLRSGERVPVEFVSSHLVFMLGDGVDQYLNTRMRSGPHLRATPHAMTMPDHGRSESRVWYGRMFLPPRDALSEAHGISYGSIRDRMVQAWASGEGAEMLSMGCSGSQRARELQSSPDSCQANQIYCWMRCMNHTPEANPQTCEAEGSTLKCTNLRDEVSDGMNHGSFAPSCSNSTQSVTESCKLPQMNAARPSTCGKAGFDAFVGIQGAGLEGRRDLSAQLVLRWSVTAEGKVKGMLAFDGKVSWMALGLEFQGGLNNGMNGGHVIMGISSDDGEYPRLAGVKEYTISRTTNAFSAWNEPHTNERYGALTEAEFTSQGCYSAMKFTTASIGGVPMNITSGSNRMIWAVRSSSYMSVAKESFHEGCVDGAAVKLSGGGSREPWIMDFRQLSEETSSAWGRRGSLAALSLALVWLP